MNISEFERNKPRKTHKEIKKLIYKYRDLITNEEITKEEDCIKVEMAADFVKELEKLMKLFKTGK